MNKNIKTIVLALLGCSLVFLAGCHDDIYYKINQEESLETNGLTGSINSFVRFGSYLYTQNGNIYRKTASSSSDTGLYNEQWTKVVDTSDSTSQFYGTHIEFLASDATYLYAFVITYYETDDGEEDLSTVKIYYTTDETATASSWTAISTTTLNTLLGSSDSSGTTDIARLFCNRAVKQANRNAYARLYSTTGSAYHVYKLNGGSTPTLISDGSYGASSSTVQAAYLQSKDYFSSYHAFVSNASDSSEGTYLYYSKGGSTLYYATAATVSSSGITDAGSMDLDAGTIYDIGVTSDYLLLGTSAGIAHTALSSDIPSSSTSDFTTNADSTLTSSYLVPLLFVLDPSKGETSTDLYGTTEYSGSYSSSTSALFNEIGLWAYYPGRGSWNKDGTADSSSSGN